MILLNLVCRVSKTEKYIYFQEETDTRVVLHLQYAEYSGFKDTVVRSPDTDIFFILLHYALSFRIIIHLDTGTGKHRQLIDVTALAKSLHVGSDYATALMGLYVYTWKDCNSAFKSKGKVPPPPLKKLQQYPRFQKVFQDF